MVMTDKQLQHILQSAAIHTFHPQDEQFVQKVMHALPEQPSALRAIWMIRAIAVLLGIVILCFLYGIQPFEIWSSLRTNLSNGLICFHMLLGQIDYAFWSICGLTIAAVTILFCRQHQIV